MLHTQAGTNCIATAVCWQHMEHQTFPLTTACLCVSVSLQAAMASSMTMSALQSVMVWASPAHPTAAAHRTRLSSHPQPVRLARSPPASQQLGPWLHSLALLPGLSASHRQPAQVCLRSSSPGQSQQRPTKLQASLCQTPGRKLASLVGAAAVS